MLTNERVQRLIDTDREALVELMALVARSPIDPENGFDSQGDTTINGLLDDVEVVNDSIRRWPDDERRMLRNWNREMSSLMQEA